MSDQIQRLREVAEAATEGPWKAAGSYVETVHLDHFGAMAPTVARVGQTKADAQHIATFDPPTVLELLDRLERAEAAVERLERWKAEATSLFDGMQDLGRALGVPLGTLITAPAATGAARELRATVERVRRLAREFDDLIEKRGFDPLAILKEVTVREAERQGYLHGVHIVAGKLNYALDGGER